MKILIVDDHAIVRKGLMELLRNEFSQVVFTEATSSEEAISLALNQQWDLILLDISLPGRNGIDTLKQLRADHAKVPILMISMQPEEQYALRSLKAGAAGYVSKDSANEELIKAVNRVLQGRTYLSEKLTNELLQSIGILAQNPTLEHSLTGNLR